LGLINEILDLSKVEAGKMPIDPREIQLPNVVEYVEQTFRHMADQKGLGFDIKLAKEVPGLMYTDINRLHQILKNLLSNAFKFTEQGQVELAIRLSEGTNPKDTFLAFSVKDTGIGIPEEKQSLIFEAFQQADGTTSRKYGGTGLGLTISREIARLLGGWIEVQSKPGVGSTFTLFLPQNYSVSESRQQILLNTSEVAIEPMADIPPLPVDAHFTGKKVLLMDDDIRNIFAINSVLQSHGINVLHAENGKVGVELLKQNPSVDLVLMDTMMPEMDGLTATAEIRKISRFQNLPIISLTAKAMKGDREKALEAGASEYITKPVDPEKLLSVIHVWLKKSELEGEVKNEL
jgi:CheY-like chemotaxis protein